MAHADRILTDFRHAEPFPHLVVDNFMPEAAVREFVAALPGPDHFLWKQYRKGKRGIRHVAGLRKQCRAFVSDYLALIERVVPEWTGHRSIIPDTTYAGAGIHAVAPGGSLGVHVDFNELKKIKGVIDGPLYRVLNTFLYLNEDWRDEWGGGLALYEPPDGMRPGRCVKTIAPAFNRFVVFESSDRSWHGHPEPLRCPEGRERLSLAVYWYTREKPRWFRQKHSTVYVK